jgi:hypothetical protein
MTTKITEAFVSAVLELSDNGLSKISERERELFGLSSDRLRSLINNLCSKENTNYLELGVYKGSTIISALYGNPTLKAVGVDNYKYDEREPKKWAAENTVWENVRSQLHSNISKYKDPDMKVNIDNLTIIESNFQDIEWDKQGKFDICFFDISPAKEEDYEAFFTKVIPAMKTESVIMFSNYSNDKNANDLQKALEKHKSLFDVQWRKQRISSGLSDATQYFSGILIVGIKRNITKKVENK